VADCSSADLSVFNFATQTDFEPFMPPQHDFAPALARARQQQFPAARELDEQRHPHATGTMVSLPFESFSCVLEAIWRSAASSSGRTGKGNQAATQPEK
jgi:hypothetical protein